MVSITIDRVDGLSSTTAIKGPVRVASTENLVLAGLQTVDSAALVAGDRVLAKDQTDARENGIYVVDTGPWRRSQDFASNRDVRKGTMALVTEGPTWSGTMWMVVTDNPIVVGEMPLAFENVAFTVDSRRPFKGAWSSSAAYIHGDLVESGGTIWMSLRNNTNVSPVEGDDWTLFLPGVTVADETVTPAKLVSNQEAAFQNKIGVREVLVSTRTYYVRTDGNDTNDGGADTTGRAFLTIGRAIQVAHGLDTRAAQVIIKIANGTYQENNSLVGTPPFANRSQLLVPIIIRGNTSTEDSVVIDGGLFAYAGARFQVEGVKFAPTTEVPCLSARGYGSSIYFKQVNFGQTIGNADHLAAGDGGYIECIGNYRITGGAYNHIHQTENGQIRFGAYLCTLTGTMAFTGQFCGVAGGVMFGAGMFWNASAATVTGRTYLAHYGGSIRLNSDTNAGFPGSLNGFEQTGGRKDRQPIFQAHRNGVDQSFAVGATWVDIDWTQEGLDTGAMFDLPNDRVVSRGGGIFLHAQAGISGMTSGDSFEVRITKNATEVATGRGVASGVLLEIVQASLVDYASPNDIYKAQVRVVGTAGTKTLNGTVPYTKFSGYML